MSILRDSMTVEHVLKNYYKNPIHFVALGFGSGLSRFMPGTCGTLVAIPIYCFIQDLPLVLYLAIALFSVMIGVWICEVTANDMGVHDHKSIVWDEIAGYLLTMVAVPKGWFWIMLGFILFRLFDIWKPEPIREVDRKVNGGFGIMFDDVLAAGYAWFVMQVMVYLIPGA